MHRDDQAALQSSEISLVVTAVPVALAYPPARIIAVELPAKYRNLAMARPVAMALTVMPF